MTEVKNKYETVLVLSAKLGEEGSAELVEKFKALIAEHGTVEGVDDWGKRRLAYPINKETEGYYTLINFESTPDSVPSSSRRTRVLQTLPRSRARPLSRSRSTWRLLQPRPSTPRKNPLQNKFFGITKESCYLC